MIESLGKTTNRRSKFIICVESKSLGEVEIQSKVAVAHGWIFEKVGVYQKKIGVSVLRADELFPYLFTRERTFSINFGVSF